MSKRIAVCAIVFLVFLGTGQAQSVQLEFDELEKVALKNSPSAKILATEFDLQAAKSRSELQWSNPELVIEQEKIQNESKDETEFVIAVGKSFKLPWAGRPNRSAWREQLKAAEYFQSAKKLELMSAIKSQYVHLKMLWKKSERLEGFYAIIERASQIASDRHGEGTLSGLENQLVQMSLFNLNSELLELERESNELTSALKLELGISGETSLSLATEIEFKSFVVPRSNELSEILKSNPGLKALHHLDSAYKDRIKMEKGNVLPEITIFGAYKNLDRDLDGYVFGVSLPLPVLNTNRAQIQQRQLEHRMLSIEAKRFRGELENEITNNHTAFNQLLSFLQSKGVQFEKKNSVIENLVYSFQEGWIDLGDVLDGIQVYSQGLDSYYSNIIQYYETAFKIEALLGKEFVKF